MSLFNIITDAENPKEASLLWEGTPFAKVHKPLFFRKLTPLFSARSLQEAKTLFLEIEKKVAKYFAIQALAKKNLLSFELEAKMEQKGFSEESKQAALMFCREMGALNDVKGLEAKMESLLRKGKGPRTLAFKYRFLQNLLILDPEKEKRALLQALAKKRRGEKSPIMNLQEKRSLYQFLLRRGFRKELIEEALREETD